MQLRLGGEGEDTTQTNVATCPRRITKSLEALACRTMRQQDTRINMVGEDTLDLNTNRRILHILPTSKLHIRPGRP